MLFRIAINLTGRGLEYFCAHSLGQTEHIDRAMNACFGRLNRVVLIMDWRRWTSEVENLINLDIKRKRDVMTDKLEAVVVHQWNDVGLTSRKKVVGTDHFMAKRDQAVLAENSSKASSACAAYISEGPPPM